MLGRCDRVAALETFDLSEIKNFQRIFICEHQLDTQEQQTMPRYPKLGATSSTKNLLAHDGNLDESERADTPPPQASKARPGNLDALPRSARHRRQSSSGPSSYITVPLDPPALEPGSTLARVRAYLDRRSFDPALTPEELQRQQQLSLEYEQLAAKQIDAREAAYGPGLSPELPSGYRMAEDMSLTCKDVAITTCLDSVLVMLRAASRSPMRMTVVTALAPPESGRGELYAAWDRALYGGMAAAAAVYLMDNFLLSPIQTRAELVNVPLFEAIPPEVLVPDPLPIQVHFHENGRYKTFWVPSSEDRKGDIAPEGVKHRNLPELIAAAIENRRAISWRQEVLQEQGYGNFLSPALSGVAGVSRRAASTSASLLRPASVLWSAALSIGTASLMTRATLGFLKANSKLGHFTIDDHVGGQQSVNLFKLTRANKDVRAVQWTDLRHPTQFIKDVVHDSADRLVHVWPFGGHKLFPKPPVDRQLADLQWSDLRQPLETTKKAWKELNSRFARLLSSNRLLGEGPAQMRDAVSRTLFTNLFIASLVPALSQLVLQKLRNGLQVAPLNEDAHSLIAYCDTAAQAASGDLIYVAHLNQTTIDRYDLRSSLNQFRDIVEVKFTVLARAARDRARVSQRELLNDLQRAGHHETYLQLSKVLSSAELEMGGRLDRLPDAVAVAMNALSRVEKQFLADETNDALLSQLKELRAELDVFATNLTQRNDLINWHKGVTAELAFAAAGPAEGDGLGVGAAPVAPDSARDRVRRRLDTLVFKVQQGDPGRGEQERLQEEYEIWAAEQLEKREAAFGPGQYQMTTAPMKTSTAAGVMAALYDAAQQFARSALVAPVRNAVSTSYAKESPNPGRGELNNGVVPNFRAGLASGAAAYGMSSVVLPACERRATVANFPKLKAIDPEVLFPDPCRVQLRVTEVNGVKYKEYWVPHTLIEDGAAIPTDVEMTTMPELVRHVTHERGKARRWQKFCEGEGLAANLFPVVSGGLNVMRRLAMSEESLTQPGSVFAAAALATGSAGALSKGVLSMLKTAAGGGQVEIDNLIGNSQVVDLFRRVLHDEKEPALQWSDLKVSLPFVGGVFKEGASLLAQNFRLRSLMGATLNLTVNNVVVNTLASLGSAGMGPLVGQLKRMGDLSTPSPESMAPFPGESPKSDASYLEQAALSLSSALLNHALLGGVSNFRGRLGEDLDLERDLEQFQSREAARNSQTQAADILEEMLAYGSGIPQETFARLTEVVRQLRERQLSHSQSLRLSGELANLMLEMGEYNEQVVSQLKEVSSNLKDLEKSNHWRTGSSKLPEPTQNVPGAFV